jgi:hypothetical protein
LLGLAIQSHSQNERLPLYVYGKIGDRT